MKTSSPSSGSDESCCPLWCRKSLTGHFLTSSVLLFVSSSSLQSQYTQGDFPTTLPQVRSHTPTDSHTDVLSFTDFHLVLTQIRSIRRQTAWFCYPASPSACQMFCCAESPQVDSSINGRLFLKEDQSGQNSGLLMSVGIQQSQEELKVLPRTLKERATQFKFKLTLFIPIGRFASQ